MKTLLMIGAAAAAILMAAPIPAEAGSYRGGHYSSGGRSHKGGTYTNRYGGHSYLKR